MEYGLDNYSSPTFATQIHLTFNGIVVVR